jgi:hypothetical protein
MKHGEINCVNQGNHTKTNCLQVFDSKNARTGSLANHLPIRSENRMLFRALGLQRKLFEQNPTPNAFRHAKQTF